VKAPIFTFGTAVKVAVTLFAPVMETVQDRYRGSLTNR
jgi:hypothetical protein